MSLVAKVLFTLGSAVQATARFISSHVVVPALRAANGVYAIAYRLTAKAHEVEVVAVGNAITKEIEVQAVLNSAMSKSHERLYLKRKAYKASVAAADKFNKTRII